MSKSIRAIETEYKGYFFRSRLEARWAVFLDTLGVKWEYEPQGFALSVGRYLPDFWLPELEWWVEVKAKVPAEEEWNLCRALAMESRNDVILIAGQPFYRDYNLFTWDKSHLADYSEEFEDEEFIRLNSSGGFFYCKGCKRLEHGVLWNYQDLLKQENSKCEHCGVMFHESFTHVLRAYTAARSARFEYGECGVPKRFRHLSLSH